MYVCVFWNKNIALGLIGKDILNNAFFLLNMTFHILLCLITILTNILQTFIHKNDIHDKLHIMTSHMTGLCSLYPNRDPIV